MNLRKKILSDPINRWVFEHSSSDVFLVGGYVRDLIIGRKSADRDFAVEGDIDKLSLDLARKFKGKVITISRFNISRVITKNREFIDITPLGQNIKSNLQKRDFTINSIAWSPSKGLIDPFDGVSDIINKEIRITGNKSLSDDPLRCLRVFRFAAELNFNIEKSTLAGCEEYAKDLSHIAEERKTDEIIKLLSTYNVTKILELSLKAKVISEVICANSLNIKANIELINIFDRFMDKVILKHPDIYKSLKLKVILKNKISQGMNGHCLIRMSILTYDDKSDEIHIKGLRLSNEIESRIKLINRAIRDLPGRITKDRLFNILNAAGKCSQEAALILSAIKGDFTMDYLKRAQELMRFINEKKVDGHDIQREMKITKGEHVGHMKEAIYRKWFVGELKTRQEIISFIRSNLT
jgi:tRNA nucleotidyltransferase/poly(A) polymerase